MPFPGLGASVVALCAFPTSSFPDDVGVSGPLSCGNLWFQARIPNTTAAISPKAGSTTPIAIWPSLLRLLFETSVGFLADLFGVEVGWAVKDVDNVAPSLVNEPVELVKKKGAVEVEAVASKADGRSPEDREREVLSEDGVDEWELLFARLVESVFQEASVLNSAQSTLRVYISAIAVQASGGAKVAFGLPVLLQ